MGTRADFYVGRGALAEWCGSVCFDGYPEGISPHVRQATDERAFRASVQRMLRDRRDACWPADGWPWPWPDSGITDYGYCFDGGAVWYATRRDGRDLWVSEQQVAYPGAWEEVEQVASIEWPEMRAAAVVSGDR